MKLSESQVHYLKAVYELSANGKGVRVIDIAAKLALTKASVSLAMTKLTEQKLICKDAARRIFLTDESEREVIQLLDKHEIICRFLTDVLCINHEIAEHDACIIENLISIDTLCAFCRYGAKQSPPLPCSLHCFSSP